VALDIARILTKDKKRLMQSDTPERVVCRIEALNTQTVQVVARRGWVQSALTTSELRKLMVDETSIMVTTPPSDYEMSLNDASLQELKDNKAKRRFQTLLETARGNYERSCEDKKVISLRYLLSPVKLKTHHTRGGCRWLDEVEFQQNCLSGAPGLQNASPHSNNNNNNGIERISASLLITSLGFLPHTITGIPPEAYSRGGWNHDRGRLKLNASGLCDVFVVGWFKRRGRGTIASNISDAKQTAEAALQRIDLRRGHDEVRRRQAIAIVERTTASAMRFDELSKVLKWETHQGELLGKPSVKVQSITQLQAVAAQASCDSESANNTNV